ncbi:MAG: hypothetical protein H6Q25_237 [Bacteroidetes bacterium]|nr:hypothetical protein [Bacteroidota bacterium]
MKINSFWVILLKILGLWCIYIFLKSLTMISYFVTLFQSEQANGLQNISLGIYIVLMILLVVLIKILLFNPNWLIDVFKLDQGFDEETLSFDIKNITIIRIAIIIIGGLLLIDTIPLFISNLVAYLNMRGFDHDNKMYEPLVPNIINLVLSLILILNSSGIVKFMDKRINKIDENSENKE